MIRKSRLLAAIAVAGLVVTSCGSDSDGDDTAAEPDAPAETEAPDATDAPDATSDSTDAGSDTSESAPAETVDEILIGTIAPLTGPNADYGAQWINGIRMAAEEINEAGGIASLGGAKLRVIEADHTGNADVGHQETATGISRVAFYRGDLRLVRNSGTLSLNASHSETQGIARQRIDLLGVKKEDLPSVWRDLSAAGFVSGHAYGKALRTVKTCVGKEWCRFGTQDSTSLGIKLERVTWGSWHPHKVKLAVSGCPRNCAEATIKDLGVVCVDSGYELHVGGNGGIKIRATDFLCKVATEEEVVEHCCAYLQLYREEARYLERTAPWIERVGLSHVRERIVEDAQARKALYARFLESQKHSQIDPWAERAAGVEAEEFAPLRAEPRPEPLEELAP